MCTPGAKGSVGMVAAKTSTRPNPGWFVMRCPPQRAQDCRSLDGDLVNVATWLAPATTRTASGFHRVKALTGPPDHDRHERQWQYPMPSGSPATSICTVPQKHAPVCFVVISLLRSGG